MACLVIMYFAVNRNIVMNSFIKMELVEWNCYYRNPPESTWQPAIRFKNDHGQLIVHANYGGYTPTTSPTLHTTPCQIRLAQSTWAARCKQSDLEYFMKAKKFTLDDYFVIINLGVSMELIWKAASSFTGEAHHFSKFVLSNFDKIRSEWFTPKITHGIGTELMVNRADALNWATILLEHSFSPNYYSDFSYQIIKTAMNIVNEKIDLIRSGLSMPTDVILLIHCYLPLCHNKVN
jgi:hypothetical protein